VVTAQSHDQPSGVPSTAQRIADFHARRQAGRQPGSPRAARRLQLLGRHTGRERIAMLLDEDSFVEIDPLVTHRAGSFGMADQRPAGDGVITGFGSIGGRPVCVYAQDATALGGSVGEAFGEKVSKVLDFAVKIGCPVIGINDSSGARIQEGVLALSSYGRVARWMVSASGVIPQISLIMGMCAGGAVYTPAATDFVVMVEKTSHMFVTGPDVIRRVTGETVGLESLGGARVHATVTGNAHYMASDEEDAMSYVRDLLSYLPGNYLDDPPGYPAYPYLTRTERDAELDTLIPDAAGHAFDIFDVIERIVDDGQLLEVHQEFAPNIVCGFARIDGSSVGVVANQPMRLAGSLDIDASEKAARFVRFCDAFNIPIVTLVDVPGFLPGIVQEHGAIIRRGAKLGFAYIEATVPKITVIVRKAFGGGYAVMGSKALGADLCFAWPTAEIGVMGDDSGVDMLFHRDLARAEDPEALREELARQYRDVLTSPYVAAERGCVDDIIAPAETRIVLVRALRALRNKRVSPPARKHSNIPL
jgi:propionyl-CoA carboxylase beta chain